MSSFAHSPFRRQDFEDTLYSTEPSWRQEYYHPQTAMLTQQWPNPHVQHMSGIHHLDVRMFGEEEQHCPDLSYSQHDTWSDIDTVGTPSTPVYSHDGRDSCFNSLPNPATHLQIPDKSHSLMGPAGSPHSSYGSISPIPSPMPMPAAHRPVGMGSIAPPSRDRKIKSAAPQQPEMFSPAEEDTDAHLPNSADAKRNNRKRARIPHTAVERRYRENLNAHLDRLRQNVPAFAARGGLEAGKSGLVNSESVKPSKCEILNGAIEHIGCLTRENVALKNEVAALRARMGDYEGWYRANLR